MHSFSSLSFSLFSHTAREPYASWMQPCCTLAFLANAAWVHAWRPCLSADRIKMHCPMLKLSCTKHALVMMISIA